MRRKLFLPLALTLLTFSPAAPAERKSGQLVPSSPGQTGKFDVGIAGVFMVGAGSDLPPYALYAGYWGNDSFPLAVRVEAGLWNTPQWTTKATLGWAFMHSGLLKQFIGLSGGLVGTTRAPVPFTGPTYGLAYGLLYVQGGLYFYSTTPGIQNFHGLLGIRFEL